MINQQGEFAFVDAVTSERDRNDVRRSEKNIHK